MAAYEALYRKWRPQTFDDIVAQPHITRTLKNQIIHEKTAHAYLFTGSRGTGKTTCARIFAKAVNCLHPKDGNPCLECEICRDAEAGALTDIIEIDGASNNGVEEVRSLRENAVYLPVRCKYKVYIIDEVHMMSPGAFNALLKIIEEPPEYVKFVFATTEIHKVPATILSRCQRFDFRRILPADIAGRIQYISEQASGDAFARGSYQHLKTFALEYASYLSELRKSISHGILAVIEAEIRENYAGDISLKYLGDKYHINSSYLGQVFRKKYGESFKNYLTNYRINEAARQIINTDKKINRIAEDVGYRDSDYFIRKFIEIMGCTPSKYRKTNRGD